MDTKKIIREKIGLKLKAQSEPARLEKSVLIEQKFLLSRWFKEADFIGFYVAVPPEVETATLIDKALKLGKRVAVPCTDKAKKILNFYEIKNRGELKPGIYGIHEPCADKNRPVDVKDLDLVVVPGVAFDEEGHRIGRGAGFYDRFLEKIPTTTKVGLAFSFQMVEKIPVQSHDQKLDAVLTEK